MTCRRNILFSGFFALFFMVASSTVAGAQGSLPKLLDLGAHKCVPCIKMAPILKELTAEYKGTFDVEFVDVWLVENRDRAVQNRISVIPTQIFFDAQGKELWRHEGFFSKQQILNKWQELGYAFVPPAS